MVRTRIAPSPTGIPHIGNTRTALYNFLFAKQNKGKFIVRIEDTDRERFVPGAQTKILEILNLLGLSWDEGPEIGGPFSPYVQSKRLKLYKSLVEELIKKGKAYYCFCKKERLEEIRRKKQKEGKFPGYDRHCLNLTDQEVKENLVAGKSYVIRLKVPHGKKISWQDLIQGNISFNSDEIDDQILLKSDGYPTYHLAAVSDDYQMKISHVLRGVEWISSTPKHILLYQAFGWQLPEFGHLPIILGPDKAKLSKRHGAKSALDLQKEGYLPEAMINFMAFLGWSYKDNSDLLTLNDLTKVFDLKRVRKASSIFDIEKLKWFNGQWIRQKSDQELARLLKPFLKLKIEEKKFLQLIPLVKERLVLLSDIEALAEFLKPDLTIDINILKSQSKQSTTKLKKLLKQLSEQLTDLTDWKVQAIEELLRKLKEDYLDWQSREFFMTIRVATTGLPVTPPLFESIAILGKKLTLSRIKQVLEKL